MKYISVLVFGLSVFEVQAQSFSPNISVDTHTGTGVISMPLYTVTSGTLSLPVGLFYDANGVRVDDSGRPFGNELYINGTKYPSPDYTYTSQSGQLLQRSVIGSSNSIKVATGWHLNAGGVIRRDMKGLPDDYYGAGSDVRKGWLYGSGTQTVTNFSSGSDDYLPNCDDEQTDHSTLSSFGAHVDTEPDLFSFSFGEYSGKFVFDHTTPQGVSQRPIHTIPYQDFKISYTTTSNAITKFEITTNTGVVYTFQPTVTVNRYRYDPNGGIINFNTSYSLMSTSIAYTEEWGLYSVTLPGTGQSITITYDDTDFQQTGRTRMSVVSRDQTAETYYTGAAYIDQTTKHYKIPKIITGLDNSVVLSPFGLQITNPRSPRNPVYFTTTEVKGRTFLRSVDERVNCVKIAEYVFNYYGVDFDSYDSALPAVGSYAQDFWGYFNNTSDTTRLYPQIYIYPSLSGLDRYRLHPIPGNNNYYLMEGANRDVDADAVIAGLLTRVFTPAKGYIQIDYESNEYYDQTAAVKFKGAGARVKKIIMHDGISHNNDMIKEYEYDANGGKLLYRPVFAYPVPVYKHAIYGTIRYPSQESGSNLYKLFTYRSETDLSPKDMNDRGIVYETVTEKQPGKGKTVYTYSMPATSQETETYEYASPYNYTATLSKLARLKVSGVCPEYGIIENGYSVFPFPQHTNYDFERGLLLNKKMYNESSQLVKEFQYTYTRLHKTAQPYVVYGLRLESHYVNSSLMYQFGKYKILTDVNKAIATEKELLPDLINAGKKLETQKNYFYESSNHRLLSRMTSANSEGVIYNTYMTYVKDYPAMSTGTPQIKALYGMNQKNMIAFPVEQIYSISRPSQPEKVTGASLTTYTGSDFVNFHDNWYAPSQQLSLKLAVPVTDFSPVATTNSGGTNILLSDSRYEVKNTFLSWNYYYRDVPVEIRDDKRNIHSAVINNSNLKKADISNALLSEVAFKGFTKPSYTPGSYGRVSGEGSTLLDNGEVLSSPSINKNPQNSAYIFSCWIRSDNAGTLTLTLTDGSNSANAVLSYPNTNSGWKFYQSTIPVTSLSSAFNATIQCTSQITISNDILVYPAAASINYYTYGTYGKTTDNDSNGNVRMYDYDLYGRITHIRDNDWNILKRITYPSFLPIDHIISAGFILQGNLAQQVSTFTALDECTPGTLYTWNFGDGSSEVTTSGAVQTHTYSAPGEYQITLVTSHSQYGGSTRTETIHIY